MKSTPSALIATACLLATACATSPEKIHAAYVDDQPYRSLSCEQLGAQLEQRQAALALDVAEQQKAHSTDAMGVFLIGLPVGSMGGHDKAKVIAQERGELEALERAEGTRGCPK